jgi:hypothetical protein
LIWVAASRWPFSSSRQAFHIGLFWAALTVAFETALGLTSGMEWRDIFADYALWNGHLWALVIVFLVAAPVSLVARRQQRADFGRDVAHGVPIAPGGHPRSRNTNGSRATPSRS